MSFPRKADWKAVPKILSENIPSIQEYEEISLIDSLYRISAKDIYSPIDVPSFDRSLVDGYALGRPSDQDPREWKVIGKTIIGKPPSIHDLKEGEAVYVPTGGIIPKNTYCVVKIEECIVHNKNDIQFVQYEKPLIEGSDIERKGADITKRSGVIKKNSLIKPQQIALLSAVGIKQVFVWKRPVVSIIITGHEIKLPGEALSLGEVYDSTSILLQSLVKMFGGEIRDVFHVGESETEIEDKIKKSTNVDLIITTGGTSVGKADNVVRAVESLGNVIFHGINVRPGKPVLFGKIGKTPVIGFPGFVTSTSVIAHLFLPLIFTRLLHLPAPRITSMKIQSGNDVKPFPGWYRVVPGKIVNLVYKPTFKTSSAISSYAESTGYIMLTPDDKGIKKGELVEFYPYLEKLA